MCLWEAPTPTPGGLHTPQRQKLRGSDHGLGLGLGARTTCSGVPAAGRTAKAPATVISILYGPLVSYQLWNNLPENEPNRRGTELRSTEPQTRQVACLTPGPAVMLACVGPRRLLLRVPNTALGSWGSVTKKRVGEKTMEGGL